MASTEVRPEPMSPLEARNAAYAAAWRHRWIDSVGTGPSMASTVRDVLRDLGYRISGGTTVDIIVENAKEFYREMGGR